MNNYGAILPRHSLDNFPQHGDIGTPQCAFLTEWFREPYNIEWPSTSTGSHDFHLVKTVCERFNPGIRLTAGAEIIVRGKISDYYVL